jgi:leucyl-tRNA synthetase
VQWYIRRSVSDEETSGKGSPAILKHILETRTLLLAPLAPHLCEELWQMLGEKNSIFLGKWPQYNPAALKLKEMEQG